MSFDCPLCKGGEIAEPGDVMDSEQEWMCTKCGSYIVLGWAYENTIKKEDKLRDFKGSGVEK